MPVPYERKPSRGAEIANLEWRKQKCRELRNSGLSCPAIAERLGITVDMVYGYTCPSKAR